MDLDKVKRISRFPKGTLIRVDDRLMVQTGKKFESGHPVWKVVGENAKPPSPPKMTSSLRPKSRPAEKPYTESDRKEFEDYKLKLTKEAWDNYQRQTRKQKLASLLRLKKND